MGGWHRIARYCTHLRHCAHGVVFCLPDEQRENCTLKGVPLGV
jgi:hypothetical protein